MTGEHGSGEWAEWWACEIKNSNEVGISEKNIFFGELEPDLGLSTVLYIPSTYVMALDNWGGGGEGMVFDCDLEYRDLSYRIL